MGTPELALLEVCQAQLGRYYGLPTRGGGLVTDSTITDAQSGHEKMAACLLPAMAGLNVVASMAMVDSLNAMSFEQFISDEEVVGFAKRIPNGIDVYAEKIAADVIRAIGPGGSILGTRHSLKTSEKNYGCTRYRIERLALSGMREARRVLKSGLMRHLRSCSLHTNPPRVAGRSGEEDLEHCPRSRETPSLGRMAFQ
jgi:hypothetical protein